MGSGDCWGHCCLGSGGAPSRWLVGWPGGWQWGSCRECIISAAILPSRISCVCAPYTSSTKSSGDGPGRQETCRKVKLQLGEAAPWCNARMAAQPPETRTSCGVPGKLWRQGREVNERSCRQKGSQRVHGEGRQCSQLPRCSANISSGPGCLAGHDVQHKMASMFQDASASGHSALKAYTCSASCPNPPPHKVLNGY